MIKSLLSGVRTFFHTEEISQYYVMKEVLGAGAFAEVRRAKEKKTGRSVAIKCISKSGKTNTKLMEQEVEVLNKVQHENCVSVIEIFDTKDTLYLVMELVTGGELFERIAQAERFSEPQASAVIKDVLFGLQHLHSIGIVHRDLKPENLLYENPSKDARVKITDFGLSKVMSGKRRFLHSRCGTPAYVAPEVLLGEPYGPKVDLWAVGVIAYLLLCGYPPFYGDTMEDLFDKICAGDYAFHADYWKDVSVSGREFVAMLLRIDPKERLDASDALKHKWIVERVSAKVPSLRSMHGLRTYTQNRLDTVDEYVKRAIKDGTMPQSVSSSSSSVADANAAKGKGKRGKRKATSSSKDSPTAAASSSVSATSPSPRPHDPLADKRMMDSFALLRKDTPSIRQAVGAPLESSSAARRKEQPSDANTAAVFNINDVPKEDTRRLCGKYPNWPSFKKAWTRGRLTGTYDSAVILESLAKNSTWKERSFEAGYIRPFLLLVSMHPAARLATARSIGIDYIEKVWVGDPHHEAWTILSDSAKGIMVRTKDVRDSVLEEFGGSGATWYDTLWRVTEKSFTSKKEPEAIKRRVAEYRGHVERIGRAEIVKACCGGPNIDLIEDLENAFGIDCLLKLQQYRIKVGRGRSSNPQLFKSLQELRDSGPSGHRAAENLELSGISREPLLALGIANFFFGERFLADNDQGTLAEWMAKASQPSKFSVLLRNSQFSRLLPVIFWIVWQRTTLGLAGIDIQPFYPSSSAIL